MNTAATEESPRERKAQAEADRAAEAAEQDVRRGESPPLAEQLHALYAAGSGLILALRRFFVTLKDLLRAEGRVLWTGIPLLFIGFVSLIALAVSLWGCAVALIGWALMVATSSLGLALGLLVAGHIVLILGLWFLLKRGVYHVSFPQARAELHAMRAQFTQDIDRFTHGLTAQMRSGPAEKDKPA
jgi:membrane-bound ClpP family serine protease